MVENKFIEIEKSPLFKTPSKKRLGEILGNFSPSTLSLINKNKVKSYVFFPKKTKNKIREVQWPQGVVRNIHSRVHNLLAEISPPSYLCSTIKGSSPKKNATAHLNGQYALKIDIKNFFPSCRTEYIVRSIFHNFQMPFDVADLLGELLTINGRLPTGSTASPMLSFWGYKRTFDAISKIAETYNLVFTLYVDDMIFSSELPIPGCITGLVRQELKKVRLEIKNSKIKHHHPNNPVSVTGIVVSKDGLRVPNEKRLEIIQLLEKYKITADSKEKNSIVGKIRSAQQIEPSFFRKTLESI